METARQYAVVPVHYLTALFERAPLVSSSGDWKKSFLGIFSQLYGYVYSRLPIGVHGWYCRPSQ